MNGMPDILLETLFHRGKDCIAIRFEKNFDLNSAIRKIPGVKFSRTHTCWYLENVESALQSVLSILTGIADIDDSAIRERDALGKGKANALQQCPAAYVDQLDRMRYSENTKKIYVNFFSNFLNYFPETPLDQITDDQVNEYMDICWILKEWVLQRRTRPSTRLSFITKRSGRASGRYTRLSVR